MKELAKYIGPGLLITIGFIDPGNWATNLAAGSEFGYKLLWVVTLSTVMLILLQHNVAKLGIITGDCLSEAATRHIGGWRSKAILSTAVIASISTAVAEILGGAIALRMLFRVPIRIGAIIVTVGVLILIFSNSYKKLERFITVFVSIIGLSFIYELTLVDNHWVEIAGGWVTPELPVGALPIVMGVLGAVVMPHNLFLHSEIIQSRSWDLSSEEKVKEQVKYEFLDTIFSMGIGWLINSAMIILAAATFFKEKIAVTELEQAHNLLEPLLGKNATAIFAVGLLFSGFSSSVTAAMAGGSIYSGIFGKAYKRRERITKTGILITILGGLLVIFFISDPFKSLILSQVFLSIQLPITILLQIYITSNEKVMGKYKNSFWENFRLMFMGGIVIILNILLFFQTLFSL